jgi:hypothetical protein
MQICISVYAEQQIPLMIFAYIVSKPITDQNFAPMFADRDL